MNRSLVTLVTMLVLAVLSSLDTQAASPAGKPLSGDKPPPAATAANAANAANAAIETAKETNTGISVLERFRSHSGPRTPAALSALFSMPLPANFRQQPEIALSDGITLVSVETALAAPTRTAPNVAFNGAQLISITRNDDGTWVIMALPAKGSWKTSMIMLNDSAMLEVHLAVAPLLPAGTDLSKQGFVTFLGNKGPNSPPQKDLNGDGKRDYLDDYIFTANYLVRQRSAATVPDDSQNSGSQDPGAGPNSDAQGSDPRQNTGQQEPGSDQSPNAQGSNAGQASTPQAPLGVTGVNPPPPPPPPLVATPPAAPTAPAPAPEITLDTSPDRHNLTNRNERARKMKELINPPVPSL